MSTNLSTATKVELPSLPYEYNALEPTISAEIMLLHHTKHHQGYVNNFNKALEEYAIAEANGDFEKMIALQTALRFNGGGHINHSIFWTNLAPITEGGGSPPQGPLAEAINQRFGSFQRFVDTFCAKAAALQGSGWTWLAFDKANKTLTLATTANQDPLSTQELIPLLGIDVWEHAYYLQYKNVRPDYLKAIWNVVNWKNVSERYSKALA